MHVPLRAVLLGALAALPAAAADAIPTALVERNGGGAAYVADGTVEAVRQTVIAAQVPGRVTALAVKTGDTVKAGAVLVRIDQRAAAQQAAASAAQVQAAEAQLEAARREFERSERLHQKKYISQAALDQAHAQYQATQAQVRASLAQAGAASTQTGFHTLAAPYAGVVAAVSTELGDMAVPGKPLVTLYDPEALRVVATVPERLIGSLRPGAPVKLDIPGLPEAVRSPVARSVTVLPTRDPVTHTVQVRLGLPADVRPAPGTFARAHLPLVAPAEDSGLTIPAQAVVKRGELQGVYVADANGRFQLRQVRLGRTAGDRITVLAGLQAGERVALDPVAAARR